MAKGNVSVPEHDPHEDRERWLTDRVRRLSAEDDFAGALPEVDHYPRLRTRDLSSFERDVRDWGLVYGLVFGLAVAEWPDAPHAELARLAFFPALQVYRRWGGEIQDPGERREAAIRDVVRRFGEWDEKRWRHELACESTGMDINLASALSELMEAAGR